MADLFCRGARHRIAVHFRGVRRNDDVHRYKVARSILDGDHLWLEAGLLELQEMQDSPRQPEVVGAP